MSTTESQKSSNGQAKAAPASAPDGDIAPGSLAEFAKLLNPTKSGDGDASDRETTAQPADKPKPKTKPTDLVSLAEALGVEPAELYEIKVPSAREGADPYTLGKLKDLAADEDTAALRTLKLEDDYRKKHAELMRTEQELQSIFAMLPKDAIKPEALAALQANRDRALVKERQLVLGAIPEWKDAELRTQEIAAMIEHLKDYGFPEQYLSGVFDHRTLRYIRANMQRETQIRKALEKVTERKPATPPKGKPQGEKPAKRAAAPAADRRSAGFAATILKPRN